MVMHPTRPCEMEDRDRSADWDNRIVCAHKFKEPFSEWNAQYYTYHGSDEKNAIISAIGDLHLNNTAVHCHRVVWSDQYLRREDAISILAKALSKEKPKINTFSKESNLTKAFDCKGTLWRDKAQVNIGGGCVIVLDTRLSGITCVEAKIKLKDSNGVTKEQDISFELTPDEFSVSDGVVPIGILTDTFYHADINWIKRNMQLAAAIEDGSQDLQIAVTFTEGRLHVKALGEQTKIFELIEALAEGWMIQWNGKEKMLRIGTEADCDAATEERKKYSANQNMITDSENGERKLTVLGLAPSIHQSEDSTKKVRDECEKFCVDGVLDDFGVKSDKNGNSFAWLRFTSGEDAKRALAITGLAIGLAKAGLSIGIPKVVVNKAVRTAKVTYKAALTKNGVVELGDLKTAKNTTGDWMADVARAYKTEPAAVAAAMVPFQEAARRGASTALGHMASEITKMYKHASDTDQRITDLAEQQNDMMDLIREMKNQLIADKHARRRDSRKPDEDMEDDDDYMTQQRSRARSREGTPAKTNKKKRGKPERPSYTDEEEASPSEDEEVTEAGKNLLSELLSTMKGNGGGAETFKRMAEQNPSHAKFLKAMKLIK
jgi:hypothetical protein